VWGGGGGVLLFEGFFQVTFGGLLFRRAYFEGAYSGF